MAPLSRATRARRQLAAWAGHGRYLVVSAAAMLLVLELTGLGLARVTRADTTVTALFAAVPVAALAMYTRMAAGIGPMLVQLTVVSLLVPFLASGTPAIALRIFAAGLVGALLVTMRTSRASVLMAGLWAGVAAVVVTGLTLPSGASWSVGLALIGGALLGGVLSGTAVLVLSPVAERVFGHVTPLTLLEVLNYDHPLLRQIMTAAPGTFLHSVNLAVLADAAARAIGADALSVRVGALYHDAGKVVAPKYFVENQQGPNPHDTLAPEESARVLRAHVIDGVSLVTDYQLGQRVIDFVREHHGTTVMRYFADKAGAEGAGLDAFRYPGPRPQSRETAIAMIGDRLEATARVTVLETLDHCQALVSETIAGLAEESQFDDSGLGEDDLQAVELAFAHTLHAMHHRRITYPPRRVRDSGARLRQAIGIGRSRGRP